MKRIAQNILLFLGFHFVILFVLWIYFPSIVAHPNEILTVTSGDSLKNYFTFVFHVIHGAGINFEGMFYPFGEHSTFTDNQPGLAIPLGWIHRNILDLSPYIFFIFHYVLLIGLTQCAFFLYKILRHYNVGCLWSLFAALIITLMNPQIFRISGHFALSYPLIPLVWFFIIKLEKEEITNFTLLAFILLSAFFGLLHPYLILVNTVFVFSYYVFKYLLKKKNNWQLFFLTFSPFVIFKVFMQLTDSAPFRPSNPWGLFAYRAKFEDVFFPFYEPLGSWFRSSIGGLSPYFAESYGYIGVAGQLAIIALLVFVAIRIKQRKIPLLLNRNLVFITCVSFFTLLVARFLPELDFVFDLFSGLRQFRSLGRLSWIFYFGFTVFSFYFLHELYRSIRKKWPVLAVGLAIIVIPLVLLDTHFLLSSIQKNFKMYSGENLLVKNRSIQTLLKEKEMEAEDFQAVFSLPVSTLGNERLGRPMPWHASYHCWPLSYQTGIPNTAINMSRSSISRSLQILQLQSSKYVSKPIKEKFSQDKPLLMVIEKGDTSSFSNYISRSEFLGIVGELCVYKLPMDGILSGIPLADDLRSDAFKISQSQFTRTDDANFCIYRDLTAGFNGYSEGFLQDDTSIILEESFTARPIQELEITLWYKISYDEGGPPRFSFEAFSGDALMYEQHFGDMEVKEYEVFGQWVRMKVNYNLGGLVADKIRLNNIRIGHLEMGNVMIKDPQFNVYSEISDTTGLYNNYLVSLEN